MSKNNPIEYTTLSVRGNFIALTIERKVGIKTYYCIGKTTRYNPIDRLWRMEGIAAQILRDAQSQIKRDAGQKIVVQ